MQQISQQIRSLERDQVRKQQPNVTDQDFAKFDAISDEVMKNLSVASPQSLADFYGPGPLNGARRERAAEIAGV